MTINTIDTTTPTIGLKSGADILNNNFTNTAHAASYEVGAGAGQIPRNDDLPTFGTAAEVDTGPGATDVPTNANLSASIAGTATFSGDVYTFSPSGTGFRPLQAGMYLSFRLPSGSSNTTTTPDISYNGSTYVIKWINGSALVADDLEQTYNKQPILFYFDGTDMLIASDIRGSNANGEWNKLTSGILNMMVSSTQTIDVTTGSSLGGFFGDTSSILFPKNIIVGKSVIVTEGDSGYGNVGLKDKTASSFILRFRTINSATNQIVSCVASISTRWY